MAQAALRTESHRYLYGYGNTRKMVGSSSGVAKLCPFCHLTWTRSYSSALRFREMPGWPVSEAPTKGVSCSTADYVRCVMQASLRPRVGTFGAASHMHRDMRLPSGIARISQTSAATRQAGGMLNPQCAAVEKASN